MTTRTLLATLERAEIDPNTGEFPMILATDGEASDGDILSIEGMQFPERAPLQNAHINEARSTLGSITRFRRDLKSTPKKLRAMGQIEMAGEGPQADIRRDIAFMIGRQHIKGVSVRWEPIEWIRRTNLPSDHPAFVDAEKETDWRKRYGLFFKKSRVLEGSIAPVQADPQSMIGRADETEGEVAAFWRSMAEDTRERQPIPFPDASEYETEFDFMRAALPVALGMADSSEDAHDLCRAAWQERQPDEDEDPAEPSEEARAAAAAATLRQLQAETGLDAESLLALAQETYAPELSTEEQLRRALTRIDALEAKLSERDPGRVSGEPAPPNLRTVSAMVGYLEEAMRRSNEKALALVQSVINVKRGRITPGMTAREALEADANALLEEMRRQDEQDRAEAQVDIGPMLTRFEELLDEAREKAQRTFSAAAERERAVIRAHEADRRFQDAQGQL